MAAAASNQDRFLEMSMTRTLSRFVALVVAIAATLAATPARAQEETGSFDITPKFRARIAKEKAKQASKQSSQNASQGTNGSGDSPQCGSQSIGNIDTNGRAGTAPREVFVFAPNAINLVSSNGCN
jgi:hypothetical protein